MSNFSFAVDCVRGVPPRTPAEECVPQDIEAPIPWRKDEKIMEDLGSVLGGRLQPNVQTETGVFVKRKVFWLVDMSGIVWLFSVNNW